MITAERKPMEELIECLRPYHRILLVGCNECVTACAAGGRKKLPSKGNVILNMLKSSSLTLIKRKP